MGFNAAIKFTGLCAFVRNTSRERMSVLLVNARLGGLVSDPRHAHTPAIIFDIRDLEDPDGLPRPAFHVFPGNIGIWELKHDEIVITPRGGTNNFEFPDPSPVGLRPTPRSRHLLGWLPRMGLVSSGAGPIRDDCLQGSSVASTSRVVARVRVSNGKPIITTHTSSLGSYIVWDFQVRRGAAVSHAQTLAEVVEIGLRNLEELVFDAAPFGGRVDRRLRLKHKSGGENLIVGIKNVELEQIIRPRYRAYPDSFEDFVYFYRLCQGVNLRLDIPHIREDTLFRSLSERRIVQSLLSETGQILALTRPICPGAVFDDSRLA